MTMKVAHCRRVRRKVCFAVFLITFLLVLLKTNEDDGLCHTNSQLRRTYSTRKDSHATKNPPSFMSKTLFPYNIEEVDLCSGFKSYLFVIVVHSALDHFDRRANIRSTWANPRMFSHESFKLVFLLGVSNNRTLRNNIVLESNKHHDIVQGNFIDTYHNLTHKSVMGLRWLTENCLKTEFVVKVDDDVFLNTFKLMKYLTNDMKDKERHIYCEVRAANQTEICRDKRWAVPDDEFPGLDFWPFTYCPGFIVILTSDLIEDMYTEARRTPFLWLDDVYLTGVLPYKVGDVTHIGLSHLNTNEDEALECFRSKEEPCDLFVTRAVSQGAMQEMLTSIINIQRNYLI